jgi:serine/threonine protein kinase
VVHRDVTPSNIMMTSAGAIKLLDFGVARYNASEVRTQDHVVKGKPAYLAPEALEGKAIDGRVDLFSLGIVLYEMLTLGELFAGDNELATLRKVLEMPVAAPSEVRPDVPAALDAIIMKALARNPEDRYATAADMARDLNEFVVSSRLHADEVVAFIRGVEELLAQPRPGPAEILAGSADTILAPTGPEGDDIQGGATKPDLDLALRMSEEGRSSAAGADKPTHD